MKSLVVLSAFLVLAGCSQPQWPTAGGETVDWGKLRGQWVLVNYWAEWCEPCLEEIPELNRLAERPGIRVLGVNYDGKTGAPLGAAITEMGIEFTVLEADPAPDLGWQRPLALPATFVVSPEGELHEARFGPQTRQELLDVMRQDPAGAG